MNGTYWPKANEYRNVNNCAVGPALLNGLNTSSSNPSLSSTDLRGPQVFTGTNPAGIGSLLPGIGVNTNNGSDDGWFVIVGSPLVSGGGLATNGTSNQDWKRGPSGEQARALSIGCKQSREVMFGSAKPAAALAKISASGVEAPGLFSGCRIGGIALV